MAADETPVKTSETPREEPGEPRAAEKKVFHIKRAEIGFNVVVQVLVLGGIIAMLNFIAYRHYKRWDFSHNQKYALSGKTISLLHSLQKPVKIVVFFSPDPRLSGGDILDDVDNLLKEYQYAAKEKLEIEKVDPFRNFTR